MLTFKLIESQMIPSPILNILRECRSVQHVSVLFFCALASSIFILSQELVSCHLKGLDHLFCLIDRGSSIYARSITVCRQQKVPLHAVARSASRVRSTEDGYGESLCT